MQYTEMTYKEKREFEATLTTAQRGKIRKMEKEFTEQTQPIRWASNARLEEVRKIAERVKDLEDAHAPQIFELREKIQKLQEELSTIQEKVSETRSKIQAESYSASYADPQVKAMDAIEKKMKEQQHKKLQSLIEGFKA
jgi:dGTP triphosphohydrolase